MEDLRGSLDADGCLRLSIELPRVDEAVEQVDVVDEDMAGACCGLEVLLLQSVQRDVAGRRRDPSVVTDLVQESPSD